MTRDRSDDPSLGSDADEQVDADRVPDEADTDTDADSDVGPDVGPEVASEVDPDTVLAEASASADEEALADAGLPQEGVPAAVRRPARGPGLGHRLYNGEAGLDVVRVGLDRWQMETALVEFTAERRLRKM